MIAGWIILAGLVLVLVQLLLARRRDLIVRAELAALKRLVLGEKAEDLQLLDHGRDVWVDRVQAELDALAEQPR